MKHLGWSLHTKRTPWRKVRGKPSQTLWKALFGWDSHIRTTVTGSCAFFAFDSPASFGEPFSTPCHWPIRSGRTEGTALPKVFLCPSSIIRGAVCAFVHRWVKYHYFLKAFLKTFFCNSAQNVVMAAMVTTIRGGGFGGNNHQGSPVVGNVISTNLKAKENTLWASHR